MTKKIWFVTMETGCCGQEGHDIFVTDADATQDTVQGIAFNMAIENAASYGVYHSDEFDEDEGDDFNEDMYTDNIEGYAVPYVPEEHDQYCCGGGTFQKEAEYLLRI